jgi:hypothetical protein
MQYLSFETGLFHFTGLSPVPSIFQQPIQFHSSLWLCKTLLGGCVTFPLSIHLLMGTYANSIVRLIGSNTAISIGITGTSVVSFGSFGHTPRSGMVGSYESSIFNFLRNLHNGWSSLHSYQQ